ncbi:unnamed protein product [Paramecium pentaurelia]|uniref:Uncharacterized protein n=1 Tax=Paramecium pentaurelia TaxID=43138 RepID=A0A8S1WH03_9CILI|nr:unnamed protein product [Paramecium pentaurelia]
MKNKIVSLFVKREHLILLSKMQLNEQNELILEIDQVNQKVENTILKTERWPQLDLDYFQNSFVQIVNLTFTYYKMYFPVNSALQIREHLKFTQSLKQINYGGITLEEVFKQQRLRLVTSLSTRLQEEPLQPKIVNNKQDFDYISLLQSKYFNLRNPDYQQPYLILNLKLFEMKPNTRPLREISIFSIQDVPQFQLINPQLIQPIINYDTLSSTYEYKFNKLMQRNSQIQQTIKNYYQQIKLFEDKYYENDKLKQLFTQKLRECTFNGNQIKIIKQSKIQPNLSQIQIETEKISMVNSLNSNDSERNKSFQQSIKRVNKNESFCEYEKIRVSDRQQKLKNRIRNLNTMIFNQVNNVRQNQIIHEQNDDSLNLKQNNQQIIKDQSNLRSLTQYTLEDSFKVETNVHQSYQANKNPILKQLDNQFKDEDKQYQLIDQLSSSIEIQGQRKNYKFRRSQYAPENRKLEDGIVNNNNNNNTEHIKQNNYSIKKQNNNKSIERLTLKPIDYVQVCSGDQKLQQNEQLTFPKKQKRYQTQEKEELELNEILKWKKQSNQSLRNALLLLQQGRSEQLLTSLMASGTIKHQQYQSFLQPIKIYSKAKYLTPK